MEVKALAKPVINFKTYELLFFTVIYNKSIKIYFLFRFLLIICYMLMYILVQYNIFVATNKFKLSVGKTQTNELIFIVE